MDCTPTIKHIINDNLQNNKKGNDFFRSKKGNDMKESREFCGHGFVAFLYVDLFYLQTTSFLLVKEFDISKLVPLTDHLISRYLNFFNWIFNFIF